MIDGLETALAVTDKYALSTKMSSYIKLTNIYFGFNDGPHSGSIVQNNQGTYHGSIIETQHTLQGGFFTETEGLNDTYSQAASFFCGVLFNEAKGLGNCYFLLKSPYGHHFNGVFVKPEQKKFGIKYEDLIPVIENSWGSNGSFNLNYLEEIGEVMAMHLILSEE